MKKFLRTLMLMALMMPLVSQAQNCQPVTVSASSAFTEGFEGGSMPTCWTQSGNGTWSVATGDYSASTGAHTGTYNAKITHGTTGNTTKLITPVLDMSEFTVAQLTFWQVRRSWAGDFDALKVYYRTSTTGDWTELASYTTACPTWTEETINLTTLSATFQIAFEFIDDYGYGLGLDDIRIGAAPTCFPVTNLAVDSATTESITLTWSDALNNDNPTYVLYLLTPTDTTEVENYTVTDTTALITGLTANTLYRIGVQVDCGEGDVTDMVVIGARTACATMTIDSENSYFENLNSYTTNATSSSAPTGYPNHNMPACWSFLNMSASTSDYPQAFLSNYSSYAVSGNCLFFKSSSATPLYAVLPDFEAEGMLELSFSYRNEGVSAYNGRLFVGVMTNPNDATTFTALDSCDQITTITRKEVYVSSEVLTEGARLAFCYRGGSSNNYYLSIDDVKVRMAPTCMKVTHLNVIDSLATASSMTLTWESDGENFIIVNMADTTEVEDVVIEDNVAVISGLEANTAYRFGVVNDCGDETSDTVYVSGRTACGMISSVPWIDSLEAVPSGSNVMPFCWSRLVLGPAGSAVYPYDYNYSTYAHSGSRSLYFYWYPSSTYTTYADTVIAILPQIDIETLDLSELQLSFYGRMGSGSDTVAVQVGTMSDPEDGTTFSMLGTVRVGGATHTRYDVNLTEAVTTDAYVAILVVKPTGSKSLYIDDVMLHEQPSCAYVTELHAIDSLATETSVTLAWTDANNENATYTIYVNGEPVADNVDETTYTIEDLSPSTSYTVTVQANCSDADAEMSTAISARTACGTPTIDSENSYFEDFNSYTTDATSSSAPTGYPNHNMPACWSFLNMSASTSAYPQAFLSNYSSYAVSGNCLFFKCSKTTPLYAILPAFETEAGLILTFNYRNEGTGAYNGTLSVGVMTNATDATSFTNVETFAQITTITEKEVFIPAALLTEGARIAFRYTGGTSDNYYLSIDNVMVEELSADYCYTPTNFAATEVGNYTTVLNWVEGGSAEAWQIMVNGDTNSYLEVEEVPYTMTVEPDSSYTVRVRAVCGDENMSEWSNAITFHTLVACPTPTNLHVVDSLLTATEATMAWTGFDDNYTVSYRVPQTYEANFFDDFESGLSGWTIRTLGATATSSSEGWYTFNPSASDIGVAHSGNLVASAWSWNSSAIDADNWLITPQVTFGSTIKFWTRTNEGYPDSYEVLLSTTGNANADFTDTLRAMAVATGTWTEVTLNTSSYTGQQGYIAIHHEDYDANYLFIDDFGVYGDAVPATDWITSTTTDNFVNLTGLTANTTYEFMLQGLCGTEDTTAWLSTTFTTLPTCTAVTNVAAIDVTNNSITLSWLDRNAAGATYIVTDAQGNEYTTTSVADTGCVITDLSADSLYNIVVKVVCAAGDTSSAAILNVRTLCDAIAIPYMEDFEATSAHLNCWSVYNIASSTGLATGGINGSYCFKFSYNTNPPQYLISPMLDIPEGDSVLLEFRYKAYSTSWTESFQVGYSYTGNSVSDFIWLPEVTTNVTSYQLYSQMLSDSVKFISIKYTANDQFGLYIDSLYIGLPPTCFPVTNLTASNVTASSITLSWEGTSTSYSIYNGTDYVANTTATTYTFNGLTASTAYTFGVRGVCSEEDSAAIATINARTECGAMSLPFTENFDASLSSNPCWAGSTSITADEVFNGGSLTLGAIGWIYSDAESNGLPAGHYRVNIYGSTCKKWLVTPQIDLSTVASAELTFKAAFTKYSGTSVADTDNIADDKFMVIVSTDGGQTWLQANATNISLPSLASLTYQTVTVDMTSYVGNTVRIAFYAESTVSGNDNNLHIDSISVTGSGDPIIPDTTYYTLTVTVNDATLGSVSATGLTNGTGTYVEGTNVALTATPANNAEFVGWVVNNGTDTIRTNPYTVTMNANKTVKAFFKARVGIADIDMTNVKIYSTADKVIVIGAEGRQVYVFDVNGRMIQSVKAKEHEEFVMAADGVYLVKVGNAAARRPPRRRDPLRKASNTTFRRGAHWAPLLVFYKKIQ